MFHPVHRSSALLRILVVSLIALLPSLAHAQTLIDFSQLPACASTCSNFVNAQTGCVPPAAAVTTQQTYVSCFCQSALLTNLRAGSGADCASVCPNAADQTAIQQWYAAFCASGGQAVTSSATSSTTSATAATSSAADSTSTTNSNAVINDYDGDGDPSNNYEGSWISAHWKWVIMLAVIFLAMIAFSILGVWLKRRHRARRDAQRSNLAHGGEAGPGGPSMTGAIPPPPPMAHLKNANDSGTLASTLDLSSTTAGAVGSAEAVAAAPGRPRSRTNTLTRFPNGSMSNVGGGQQQPQPQPVVWGPHQHQAATRGYEYHNGGGSPGPSVPPSPVNNVPTPSLTPVGGYSSNTNNNRYNPGGSGKDNAKSRSRDVTIDEMADEEEDVVEQAPAPVPLPAKEKLRRKLSKR
ncbi:putative integral membrane protein [Diplodia seriata]|uniref:Putative integral membrane protein n=1 Tax=Diplodia seriata TaxID=420778 RepID=A0A0G2DS97_9PEZI|nr:putative integral membrane protein [Diplodia seriata]